MIEKPTLQQARGSLKVDGLEEDEFLTAFGYYIVSKRIFPLLEQKPVFTEALNELTGSEGLMGLRVEGERFDLGSPSKYMQTMVDYKAARERFAQHTSQSSK